MDWDLIVIGSGFGGAVAALRAAEKGHRVLVLEQGREVSAEDMRAAAEDPKRLLLEPGEGFYRDPAWVSLPARDWRAELAPHYATAARMLGRAVNPRQSQQD